MTVATHKPQTSTDRLITLQGEWAQFQLIQQGCEQTSGARLSYFDGTIEILMPGQAHETFSRIIGWMLTYSSLLNRFHLHQRVRLLRN